LGAGQLGLIAHQGHEVVWQHAASAFHDHACNYSQGLLGLRVGHDDQDYPEGQGEEEYKTSISLSL
jgi:hypothetical protein